MKKLIFFYTFTLIANPLFSIINKERNLHSLNTPHPKFSPNNKQQSTYSKIYISPNAEYLICLSEEFGSALLLSIETGNLIKNFSNINDAIFSKDKNWLATIGYNKKYVEIRNLNKLDEFYRKIEVDNPILSVSFNNSYGLAICTEKEVRLYAINTPFGIPEKPQNIIAVYSSYAKLNTDFKYLSTTLYNNSNNKHHLVIRKLLMTSSKNSLLEYSELCDHENSYKSIDFDSTTNYCAISRQNDVAIIKLSNQECTRTLNFKNVIQSVFSNNNKYLACKDIYGTIRIYQLDDSKCVQTFILTKTNDIIPYENGFMIAYNSGTEIEIIIAQDFVI